MSTESPLNPSTDPSTNPSTPPASGTAARRARQAAEAGAATGARGPTARDRDRSSVPRRPTARAVGRPADPALRRELDPDRLAALEEERDFLLRSLADLEREHDVGDVDEHDYAALKDDYTVRAAATLRAIESRQATLDAVRSPRSRGKTWAAIGIVALIAVALGVFVAASAGRRGAGDSLSGNIRQTSRDQVAAAQQIMGTDPKGALEQFEQVLQTSPDNVEASTYKGWLLYISSQSATDTKNSQLLAATGLRSLTDAIGHDPKYPDARIFRAIIYKNLGQPEAAAADLALVPDESVPIDMRPLVDKVRGELNSGPAGTTPATQP